MFLISVLMMWWNGTSWYTEGPFGDVLRDVNGTALSVGQTVKIVGTIAVMDANDPHFSDVTVNLLHPNGPPGQLPPGLTLRVHPLNLVVGS